MQLLLVSRRSNPVFKLSPVLDGVAVPLKEQVHRVRMLLDPVLLLDKHMQAASWNGFYQLQLVSQPWLFLGSNYLANVVHYLDMSRAD